jgi:hypothetical protein
MGRRSELASRVVEIAAGAIVGYVAYAVSAPANGLAGLFGVMIGLLTTLVVAQLFESYRHSQDISRIDLHLVSLLQKIGEREQEASDFAHLLRYGVSTIPREQYLDAFQQLLWRFENKILAANYVNPDEAWGRAYIRLFNEIQRSKIDVNKATIRRVFIVDSEEEVGKLRSVMSEQKEAGVKVKYIFRRKIETTSMLKMGADGLETLDFDIVDSKYVWITLLDRDRKIKYGRVLLSKEECDRYKRFYDHLYEEAEEIEVTS